MHNNEHRNSSSSYANSFPQILPFSPPLSTRFFIEFSFPSVAMHKKQQQNLPSQFLI
jgi:hypothetical protein